MVDYLYVYVCVFTSQSCSRLQCSYIRTGASKHQWPTVERLGRTQANAFPTKLEIKLVDRKVEQRVQESKKIKKEKDFNK